LPRTIYEINRLPEEERSALVSALIPPRLLEMFRIDPRTFRNPSGAECAKIVCPEEMPFFQIDVRRDPGDATRFLCELPFGQMEISFIIVNDPDGERYDIDVDDQGHDTYFGTARRNVPEEIRAMGRARARQCGGLRMMRRWSRWTTSGGPAKFYFLAAGINSAIPHERSGFQCGKGRKDRSNAIPPGGELHARLDEHSVSPDRACPHRARTGVGDPRRDPRRTVGEPEDVQDRRSERRGQHVFRRRILKRAVLPIVLLLAAALPALPAVAAAEGEEEERPRIFLEKKVYSDTAGGKRSFFEPHTVEKGRRSGRSWSGKPP
jgi:hypothetical protein